MTARVVTQRNSFNKQNKTKRVKEGEREGGTHTYTHRERERERGREREIERENALQVFRQTFYTDIFATEAPSFLITITCIKLT
jgi:hypothetical protein